MGLRAIQADLLGKFQASEELDGTDIVRLRIARTKPAELESALSSGLHTYAQAHIAYLHVRLTCTSTCTHTYTGSYTHTHIHTKEDNKIIPLRRKMLNYCSE